MTDQELTQLIFQSLLIINHPQNLVTSRLLHLGPSIYLEASTYIKLIKSNGHCHASPGNEWERGKEQILGRKLFLKLLDSERGRSLWGRSSTVECGTGQWALKHVCVCVCGVYVWYVCVCVCVCVYVCMLHFSVRRKIKHKWGKKSLAIKRVSISIVFHIKIKQTNKF